MARETIAVLTCKTFIGYIGHSLTHRCDVDDHMQREKRQPTA